MRSPVQEAAAPTVKPLIPLSVAPPQRSGSVQPTPPARAPATRTPLPGASALSTPLPAQSALATPIPAHPALGTPLPPLRTPVLGVPSALPPPVRPSVAPVVRPSVPPVARPSARPSAEPARPVLPPSAEKPSQAPPRELPAYESDGVPQAEQTRVDFDIEARARAMNSGEVGVVGDVGVGVARTQNEPRPGVKEGTPGFAVAMRTRVRFAGGEVPIWSLVVPLVLIVALAAALGASVASRAETVRVASALVKDSASEPVSSVGALLPVPEAARATPSAEPGVAAPRDAEVLVPREFPSNPATLSAAELFAIAEERSQRERALAKKFERALDRDPGAIKEAETLAELRRLVENPETARLVLGSVARLPAPVSADILYELWTSTVERSEMTELARALLYSRDVRPKASAALAVALDLRAAERCEDAKAILPRVSQDGDRRALPIMIKLQRKYGCGPNKHQDCYPCLRSSGALEEAMRAVKDRREPRALVRR